MAAFVRRWSRVRSSSRSCRNLKSERIVSSATFAAVTSRASRSRRGGSVGTREIRDSRYRGWPSCRLICAWPESGSRANDASAPSTEAASADQGWPSIVTRSMPTIRANASLARTITSRSSSSTNPSTAASNTSRRCSSERRSVSFASRTRSSAMSASCRAASRRASASCVSLFAWVLAIWFARTRAAMPPPRSRIIRVDCSVPTPRSLSSRATVASAAHAATIDVLVRTGRASRRRVPAGPRDRAAPSRGPLRAAAGRRP